MTEKTTYSLFNQKELKSKITLLNFLIVMKYLKNKGCIKKNGKFPLKEHRHGGRSGYDYYFGIALGRLLKELIGGKWRKQRSGFDYKTLAPFEKLKYDSNSPDSFSNTLVTLELRNELNSYNFISNNQSLRLNRSNARTYWSYSYQEQVGSNYSPIDFFDYHTSMIPKLTEEEMDGIINDSVVAFPKLILQHFGNQIDSHNTMENAMNASSVQESLNELIRETHSELNYSEETRQLVIQTANDLLSQTNGVGLVDVFTLAKTFLADNQEAQYVRYEDVVNELQAA